MKTKNLFSHYTNHVHAIPPTSLTSIVFQPSRRTCLAPLSGWNSLPDRKSKSKSQSRSRTSLSLVCLVSSSSKSVAAAAGVDRHSPLKTVRFQERRGRDQTESGRKDSERASQKDAMQWKQSGERGGGEAFSRNKTIFDRDRVFPRFTVFHLGRLKVS